MNVLITGGRGGIGSLITLAISAREKTRVVTLGRSTPAAQARKENVVHEVGDVTNAIYLSGLLERHRITHIIHTAGLRTRDCRSNPRLAFEGNILGTARMAEAAAKHSGMVKIIHFSTAAVYGRRAEYLDENADIAAGTTYAISKAASELVLALSPDQSRPFATVILRPGFVLAPGGDSLLASLIRMAATMPQFSGMLPEHFPLHWAPDLAEIVARLLESDTGPHRVLHPPGINTGAEEFAHCLVQAVSSAGKVRSMQSCQTLQHRSPQGL